MLPARYAWSISSPDAASVSEIARAIPLHEPIAKALVNRGITSVDVARYYLNPTLDGIHDPYLMRDMDAAVTRVLKALENKERILVLGDYDVDGITGAALLVSFLRELGGHVNYYIPSRVTEGYGLSCDVVRKCQKAGYGLILTVDSGVSAVAEARLARECGMDMIITDHHEPPPELPQVVALLDPKRADCDYPFRDLAGVGVAFKLVCALGERTGFTLEQLLEKYSEIVALGTIGDMVGLLDENRALAHHGLKRMSQTRNLGLHYLLEVSGYADDEQSDTYMISFGLAPRINAAGRMWNPRAAVDLLLCNAADRASQIAERLDHYNRARIREESDIFEQAHRLVTHSDTLDRDKALVLFNENWNIGVVGIVASKLIERYYRPVVLLTQSHRPDDENNPHPEKGRICQGSVRSIVQVDIFDALSRCSELLLSFGGHRLAAGVKIYENDIPKLRDHLNSVISEDAGGGRYYPVIKIDSIISLSDVNFQLLNQSMKMEPCGTGNPKPVFAVKNVAVLDARPCGADGKHLLLRVAGDQAIVNAIGFNFFKHRSPNAIPTGHIDVAFTLKEDCYHNVRSVKMNILDLCSAD
jgi:single-stranded-DNA-specific exonuclease